ncbi:MAG: DUF5069 domain-containing protein [Candidatus Methylacidiphilales bacterium]|nr:DUF5069 domain-containing protein [Candidatus Methylacidiphilales bacterium]
MSNTNAKDLSKVAPRSPRVRLGGYPLLARAIDKGRASLAGSVGDYHFDCPLDNYLFGFKEVKGEDVKQLLANNASDQDVVEWLNTHGAPKTAEEINAFAAQLEAARPYDNPDKKQWFIDQCASVGIDPAKSTLFDFLETDDALIGKQQAVA